MTKRILSVLFAVLLLSALALTAFAHDVPDLTRTGTITISMVYQDKTVPGGSLTAYRVADVATTNGDFYFAYTADYAQCPVPVEQLHSAELPVALAKIAAEQDLSGVTRKLDDEGKASFGDLELGLYLFVQEQAAPGYHKVAPFLVSLPGLRDGKYIYEVDASPKVSLEPEPSVPDTTTPPSLPQTGQDNWPVPVLAIVGLIVLYAGWMLRQEDRKKKHES